MICSFDMQTYFRSFSIYRITITSLLLCGLFFVVIKILMLNYSISSGIK